MENLNWLTIALLLWLPLTGYISAKATKGIPSNLWITLFLLSILVDVVLIGLIIATLFKFL